MVTVTVSASMVAPDGFRSNEPEWVDQCKAVGIGQMRSTWRWPSGDRVVAFVGIPRPRDDRTPVGPGARSRDPRSGGVRTMSASAWAKISG